MIRSYEKEVIQRCRSVYLQLLIQGDAILGCNSLSCLLRRDLRSCTGNLYQDDEVLICSLLLIGVKCSLDVTHLRAFWAAPRRRGGSW